MIGFDESLNKVAQKEQMDVSVRFCMDDGSQNKNSTVTSRYFGSAFWGHANSIRLVKFIFTSYKGYRAQENITNLQGWAQCKF